MTNLERYLDRVCRGLGGSTSLRRHLRQELREHILEAVERHKEAGLSADEAMEKAIADFGDPVAVHEGFEDVYGRDVMGILIEKAMQWKEKTMKAKWLWSGLASLLLVTAILAQGFFVFCVLWLMAPKLKEILKDAGQELPRHMIWFLTVADYIVFHYGWIWIIVVLIPWAVFEWRYRGENKPLIRLSALALVSLGTTALMWWASVGVVGSLLRAHGALYLERPEQVALEIARMADEQMVDLDRAVKSQSAWAARRAAMGVSSAFEYGYMRGSTAAGLATMTQLQRLDEIRNQLRTLTKLAEIVQSATPEQLPELSQQMQQAYDRLKALAGGWPKESQTQPASQPVATEQGGSR